MTGTRGWVRNIVMAGVSIAAVSTLVAGCPRPGTPNIVQVASDTDVLATFVTAVDKADLTASLEAIGPFTVFAPNAAAFAALPPGVLDALLLPANKAQLTKILLGHVVAGDLQAAYLKDGQSLLTLNGDTLKVAISGSGVVTVNGAKVVTPNLLASNGVIHVIDTVILSDIVTIAQGNAGLTTLVTALQAADLVDALQGDGPFTVFAPTNAAFAALPAGTLDDLLLPANKADLATLLKSHVVGDLLLLKDLTNGDTLTDLNNANLPVTVAAGVVTVGGNNAAVIQVDVIARNGVIHIINKVIKKPL